jgi:3-deoxy-manno-octulosonate cytidylyltransferase (CMP-KDO synthetase)
MPRKVLADQTGLPLIVHVCRAAERAGPARIVVACDDPAIVGPVVAAGYEAVLTSRDHLNGTSRIAEASRRIGLSDDDAVVNVQGDEPEIEPGVITAAADGLSAGGFDIVTVASPFQGGESAESPNIVKAVLGQPMGGGVVRPALYFSRARIPHVRGDSGGDLDGVSGEPLKHVGLYAYSAGFVRWYADQPETPLERAEKLEQLRALELGRRIGVVVRTVDWHGIDTPEDYRAFVERHGKASK